ncbi:hypothetical protein PHYBOEH_007289 [Phytophthora boehmeriae]|uniref:Uncharacterized protein n=1 Tax=Phytophthora boehmeriae TaxID=109152 RepID=A0A8T1X7T4_9STRA|nr:hypothetical protein PHYBOEH_007289 [Phytophthora boehmeriae]
MRISVLHRNRVSLLAYCDDPTTKHPTKSSREDPVTQNKAPSTMANIKVAKWKQSVRRTEATTPLLEDISQGLVRVVATHEAMENVCEDREIKSKTMGDNSAPCERRRSEDNSSLLGLLGFLEVSKVV